MGRPPPLEALAPHVGVLRKGEHAHAPVPRVEHPAHHELRTRAVVDHHRVHARDIERVVREHEGHRHVAQKRHACGREVGEQHHEAVGLAGLEVGHLGAELLRVVLVLHEQGRVSQALELALDEAHEGTHEGVGGTADEHAHRVGALGRERAAHDVGHVAQLPHGLLYGLAVAGLDRRAVEIARDRANGHARAKRHVLDGRHGHHLDSIVRGRANAARPWPAALAGPSGEAGPSARAGVPTRRPRRRRRHRACA